jgi:uncharacterized protein HemY
MRAHALVLLLLVALVTPATPAVSGEATDAVLEPGRQLARRGDYAQAEQFYADAAEQNSTLAPRALLLQARAALDDGDTDSAESSVQQLLANYPASDQLAGAYFTLEQARRAAGNCSGALRALDAFPATTGPNSTGQ